MQWTDSSSPQSFEWLDTPEEWQRYSAPLSRKDLARLNRDASHGLEVQAYKSQISIQGMYCANCSLSIESALKALPGVLDAQVHAHAHKAHIYWLAQHTRPSQWLKTLQALGYPSSLEEGIELDELKSKEAKLMLWRFLVALFCMMQVMMYSAPLYGNDALGVDAESIQLLHWASWVLSLPVLIFSCQPFFSGALKDLKHLQLSMDLPVAIGMLLTFLISCAVTFSPHDIWGMETYFDSLTMFATFLLGGRWLELRLRDQTLGALDAIMNRTPKGIERLTPSGHFETVSTHRLLVGDVIRIQMNQSFPADGLLKSESTWVEESLLNGESNPVDKTLGSSILAGSINLGPASLIEVTHLGDSTRFASIVHLLQEAESSKPSIAKIADQVAKPFIAVVLLCALISALWWWPQSPLKALLVASAVLIVTCPCALSLATPSALIACAGFLAKHGVLMRDLGTLERLSQMDVAVFDKTGTLTHNILQLREIFTPPSNDPAELFALARALAKHSPHPLSRSLDAPNNLQLMDPEQQKEVERLSQHMEVLNFKEVPGVGLEGTLVFKGQTLELRLGSSQSVSHLETFPSWDPLAQSAQIHLSSPSQWLGAFMFDEELKPEAKLVIDQLKAQNIEVYICSGDQAFRVQKIAAQLELPADHGKGHMSPYDKLQFIKTLQSQGHRVMMVGDGYNDLPVLAGADVSLVFGSATLLAQDRADCLVLNPSLTWLLVCLQQAKASMRVVHQNLFWAFGYNLICIPLALMGYLPSWLAGLGMALSSLGVLLNAYRLQSQKIQPIMAPIKTHPYTKLSQWTSSIY